MLDDLTKRIPLRLVGFGAEVQLPIEDDSYDTDVFSEVVRYFAYLCLGSFEVEEEDFEL